MSIEFSFAAYLQSVGSTTMDDAISPSSSTVSSSESSPTKRARSYSPDTSISSSSPPESYFGKVGIDRRDSSANSISPTSGLTFSLGHNMTVSGIPTSSSSTSGATLSTIATPCPLRSILCSTLSMHGPSTSSTTGSSDASFLSSPATTSPPMSRPLSRRSSHSTKSVRFARCTNASVFPALSGEEYDRSPIIPTQESESLELPKRHKSEEDGWIKCVERERAAAAKKGIKPDLTNCGPCTQSQQLSTKSSLESPVEGVRGLISGGYFVGEERDRSSPVLEDMAPRLGLALEESHHHEHDLDISAEDDDDDVLAAAGAVDDMVVDDEETGVEHVQDDSSGDDSDVSPSSPSDETSGAIADGESSTSDASTSSASNKCREAVKQRYGLCALGKWSRRELFTSHDSLGGF
ncbi:hypothetical protein OIO90_001503 [Microbotryomycetes sp. JL221]|nr:hypothetical protein OIO90_001503 [Microbotryomycetes sp. JL221]